jgi:hypothetical protein
VIEIHEHTLCPKSLLPITEFLLFLQDWCGRLDDLKRSTMYQINLVLYAMDGRKTSWQLSRKKTSSKSRNNSKTALDSDEGKWFVDNRTS